MDVKIPTYWTELFSFRSKSEKAVSFGTEFLLHRIRTYLMRYCTTPIAVNCSPGFLRVTLEIGSRQGTVIRKTAPLFSHKHLTAERQETVPETSRKNTLA